MAVVAALMLRRSLPAISGALRIAHMLKCARDSVSLRRPTSSMSGSFQAPGLEAPVYAAWLSMIDRTEFQVAVMSPVVRQEFPVAAPQDRTSSLPQLQIAN